MAENVLEKIIKKKNEKIVNLKKSISLESLDELINTNKTFVDFKEKIKNNLKENKFSIIAKKFLEIAITIPVKKKVIGIIMEAKPKL